MATVYSDPIFIKYELTTADGKNRIICTLSDQTGRYIADLLRQDSKGFAVGNMIDPVVIPDWMVPGVVFYGVVGGLKTVLTLEPTIQSRISGLQQILGDKVRFSYVSVSEFNDGIKSNSKC